VSAKRLPYVILDLNNRHIQTLNNVGLATWSRQTEFYDNHFLTIP